MELKKDKEGDMLRAQLKKAKEAILSGKPLEVPKETSKNHVLVGGRLGDYDYSFFNPHNSRFYFLFDKVSFRPGGSVGVGFKINNGSELALDDWLGFRFVVKKRMIEVTGLGNSERRFKIEGSADDRYWQVVGACRVLLDEAVGALRRFMGVFGGGSDLVCRNMALMDNKITHADLVDALPMRMRFRNDVVKKEYKTPPKNVEYSDPAYAANAFRNLGLHDYAPEIAGALEEMSGGFQGALKSFEERALIPLTNQIELHLEVERRKLEVENRNLKVQSEMLKTLKEIRKTGEEKRKEEKVKRARALLKVWGW